MTLSEVRSLQGRHVSVALVDRSRIDDAIFAGVVDEDQLWLHVGGRDVFVAGRQVLDLWEPPATPSAQH